MADDQDVVSRVDAEEKATSGDVLVSRFARVGGVLALGLAVLILDQLTKWWAVNRLSGGRVIDLVGSLRLNLAYNTGTAFSFGRSENLGPVIALLAVVVIVLFLLSGGSSRRPAGAVAAGLVIGGALGNLADRAFRGDNGFLHGAVIDFVDLQWWPVFNVADAAIVIGAGVAIFANLRRAASLIGSRRSSSVATPPTHHEEVPEGLAGERLDRVVSMITGVSRAEASALVTAGAVLLDRERCTRGALRVAAGALIDVTMPEPVGVGVEADAGVEVSVVHVDRDVIVVDKPAGLVVHPGAGVREGTLVNGLVARFPDLAGVGDPSRPGIVHRLDKGTSGLMMIARTPEAYDALVGQLGARSVDRRYVALVWGVPDTTRGLVDAPIGRSQRTPTRMVVSTRGREARTRYEVQESFTDPVEVSLVECRLETGRTHQIRVHLAAIGHAVVGDDRYDGARQSLVCPRPFLHAAHLGFSHPRTGEPIELTAPLPDDLRAVLGKLKGARVRGAEGGGGTSSIRSGGPPD